MTSRTGVQASPKEVISGLIEKGTDKGLGGRKSLFRGEDLKRIDFSDVMDIVLYYINLQTDWKTITKIESREFYELLKKVWDEWGKGVGKSWGYYFYEYDGKKYKNSRFYDIDGAWGSGPPDAGGPTMGAAAYYAYLHPGFFQHDYLLLFFSYPRGLPGGAGNWPSYRDNHIKKVVFPKWRRKAHKNKLESVFQLAEMVCTKMREAG